MNTEIEKKFVLFTNLPLTELYPLDVKTCGLFAVNETTCNNFCGVAS